ncbi:hypothetical protein [Paracoccus rhizosphaerae]|uniref:Uncharacterized protein n=1 Tax=Paracoccus rhizosphaerae TaxID=1133347 RepID=A0ABV6CI83_9RHOB|nr:hypothetical protein [Paracoccus rhizosphaerae]
MRAMILVLLLPISAMAAPRPVTGLLTKGSNLPARIPLQVRAPGDSDHAVILQDQDGQPVISGYLRGGEVLRLLVPPGRHRLVVAAGQPEDWQGTDRLFGEDTHALDMPLTFRIEGNRRIGHSIVLTYSDGSLSITDHQNRTICQIADWDIERRVQIAPGGTVLRWLDPQLETRSRPCD